MTLSQAAKMGLNPAELLEYRQVKAKFLPILFAEYHYEMRAIEIKKRFVSQKKYAEFHGCHPVTISKKINEFKAAGIARGSGKNTRFDITYYPDGSRLEFAELVNM